MLIGPNGSGKSTLLQALAGQICLQNGDILLGGNAIGGIPARALSRSIFLVRQDPGTSTAPGLTVREHLLLANGQRWSGATELRQAEELMDSFHLDVDINQPVDGLSGGQKQLLALLMAKVRPAPLVLLDEPLAALDPMRAARCLDGICLLHQSGKTIVFVTHDLELSSTHGDRTLGLVEGRLVYDEMGSSRTVGEQRSLWA